VRQACQLNWDSDVALIGKLKDDLLEAESLRRAKGKLTWSEDRRE